MVYFTVFNEKNVYLLYYIGGLFHPNDVNQENVFKHAIHDVNVNRHLLSRSNLSGQIEKVSPQDSFHASKRGNADRIKLFYFLLFNIITDYINYYYYHHNK